MNTNNVIAEVKSLGWSAIQLTKKRYRGAVQVYKSERGDKVPVMFYLDECWIIEDAQGLFRVEDLKDFFMKKASTVDLEATGLIKGLSLIAYKDEQSGCVVYMEDTMSRLGINNVNNREDISRRLNTVYKLGEMEDVDMGF